MIAKYQEMKLFITSTLFQSTTYNYFEKILRL